MLCVRARPIPVECVVRGYLEGSGWREYQECGAVTGISLPAGLQRGDELPEPIFTPATKAAEGHDVNISYAELEGRVGGELAAMLRDRSIALASRAEHARGGDFSWPTRSSSSLGTGRELLIDEVLTPDSSRFGRQRGEARRRSSFDKQPVRDFRSRARGGALGRRAAAPRSVRQRDRGHVRAVSRGLPSDRRAASGVGVTARVEVFVQLKEGMLDPQGKTLEHALESLGYTGVDGVRVGKWITFEVEGEGPEAIKSQVDEMCERLLANTVIERYTFTLREAGA
jgi:phosphoribosylformylglycinamidine synthase PurS subunit